MSHNITYKPVAFFSIAFLVSWIVWIGAIYTSWNDSVRAWESPLVVAGALGPLLATLAMFAWTRSPALWRDYGDRLINFKRFDLATLPVLIFLMPVTIVISILLSILFGQSPDQLTFTLQGNFSAGGAPVLLLIILIPALEEMGWRGYGVDSLWSRCNLLLTSLLFGVLWGLWHLPIFFINGYYENQLLSNWIYTANFFVSVIPTAFILNWLYARNNRSIIACFLFHMITDVSAEMFAAQQPAKCIETGILILVAIWLVYKDREVFMPKDARARPAIYDDADAGAGAD